MYETSDAIQPIVYENINEDFKKWSVFYDYYVENIAGVVCELDGTNSSGVFQIDGIPLVIDSQVRIHWRMHRLADPWRRICCRWKVGPHHLLVVSKDSTRDGWIK